MLAVGAAVLSSAPWIGSLKVPYVDASASPAMWNTPRTRRFAPRKAARFVGSGAIASATSPLNLRKLTMSDFGDVEDAR